MGKNKIYGYELILDLYNCSPKIIKSRRMLQQYVDRLCRLIKMKKYGKTLIPHFGYESPHTKGYSLVQLIETSSITGHFSELWNSAHINIFSCQDYDYKKAASFTKKFFKAKNHSNRFIVRRAK